MPPVHRPSRPVPRIRQEGGGEFAPRPVRAPQEPSRTREAAPRQSASPRRPREPEAKLSALEARILEFEARWWRAAGAKTQAIADELELTPERYYQHLARLIEHPEAAAEQPAVVRRLRAARDARRAAR